jgi:hypothetical protein
VVAGTIAPGDAEGIRVLDSPDEVNGVASICSKVSPRTTKLF